jgi:hypothetical protein
MQKGKHAGGLRNLSNILQPDSAFPCFAAFGEQTSQMLKDRFQPSLTTALVTDYAERLIVTSLGSAWTRLYDSVRIYSTRGVNSMVFIQLIFYTPITLVSILLAVYFVIFDRILPQLLTRGFRLRLLLCQYKFKDRIFSGILHNTRHKSMLCEHLPWPILLRA